jgi:hypothetical protein
MEEISFLKQASLADKMGKYKLADNLFQKALRLASGASVFEAELLKVIEKLALTDAEKELVKAGETSLVQGFKKGGAEALALILEKRGTASLAGGDAAVADFLRSVGIIEEDAITAILKEMKTLNAEGQLKLIRQKVGLEVARVRNGMPAKTLTQKVFNKENAEAAFKALGPFFKKYLIDNPNGFGKILAWMTSAGIVYDIGARGFQFFNKLTGKEISQVAIIDLITKVPGLFGSGGPESTPPGPAGGSGSSSEPGSGSGSGTAGEAGSGAGGAAGTPDPTIAPGFQYKSKDDMYERRMKAKMPGGKFQQTLQGDAVQDYVNANKDKFKTQREFYDAAFTAKDKNFANSVIALVKKDLDLPVSAQDPRRF